MPEDIRDCTLDELEEEMLKLKEPRYRGEQIFRWLYIQRADNFKLMANIPAAMRAKLSGNFTISNLETIDRRLSADGTEKFLFKLPDGRFTESVVIPSKNRNTICFSTQVGCKFGCKFCASGLMGFTRSLAPSEIIGQLLKAENISGKKITNAVFMGIGEPFDNYRNLIRTIRILNHPKGINISARKITVSTAGVVPAIEKFTSFELPVKLALSLHSTDQKTRSLIMPIARVHPMDKLIKALIGFRRAGRKLTLEYALIDGLNDAPEEAKKLSSIARRLDCPVNIISFNPAPGIPFFPCSDEKIKVFMDEIHSNGVMVSLRRSRGSEIEAACGQLAGSMADEV